MLLTQPTAITLVTSTRFFNHLAQTVTKKNEEFLHCIFNIHNATSSKKKLFQLLVKCILGKVLQDK